MNKIMSQAELQHIEHCNKILREHQELVAFVVNETEGILNTYLPILTTYIDNVIRVRSKFGEEVKHIINSSRELKHITSGAQELISFMTAIEKLDKMLTPELVNKLKGLVNREQ